MVVNLEFIRVIITTKEVLLLDPLRQEFLPFVDQLRQQLTHKSLPKVDGSSAEQDNEGHFPNDEHWLPLPEVVEGLQADLPIKFQLLEIALEVVCTVLGSSVANLERDAYPILDELAMNVSTKNLEQLRSIQSNLTRLVARVQKVREYIDHTEDYINIQLDNQSNEFIQLQLTLMIASFAVVVETLIAGWFGMSILCTLYHTHDPLYYA